MKTYNIYYNTTKYNILSNNSTNQKSHVDGTLKRSLISIIDSFARREEKLPKTQGKKVKLYDFYGIDCYNINS